MYNGGREEGLLSSSGRVTSNTLKWKTTRVDDLPCPIINERVSFFMAQLNDLYFFHYS